MPDCREMLALLSEYLDGELPVGQMREFETHICDCEPCIRFVDSLRRTRDGAKELPATTPEPPPVPPELLARIRGLYEAAKSGASQSGPADSPASPEQ